jgi:hypothetical protein
VELPEHGSGGFTDPAKGRPRINILDLSEGHKQMFMTFRQVIQRKTLPPGLPCGAEKAKGRPRRKAKAMIPTIPLKEKSHYFFRCYNKIKY